MADPYAVAKKMYPILKDYKYKIVNTPDKNSPYSLEHFPPGEEGSATMPRPKDISINEYGLQIFKDVRPEDIAGDIISHHLVNENKYLSKEYQKFKNSVSSETMMSRYEYHKNNLGEERDFNSWSERTGYPELFRGYVFNQFSKEEIDNIYNPKQKEILKNIKNYVTKKGMAKGGIAMNKQTEMAFMQQGGLKDDGMKQDPISGNSIPNGSMAEEVRDDIPAQLSEGEYVVPADVVRYYGVKHFEDIRNNAKQGLQSMEANGRIGGEPVPVGGPKAGPMMQNQQMTSDLSQDEMQEIQSMMMAVGGFVEQPTNMQQQSDPYQQQNTMYKQPMAMGASNGTDVSGNFSTNYYDPNNPNATAQAITTASPQSGSFSKSPQQLATEAATKNAQKVADEAALTAEINAGNDKCNAQGMDYDPKTKTCIPRTPEVTTGDDDPRNPPKVGGEGEGILKDWGKGVDWSDPLAYAQNMAQNIETPGFGGRLAKGLGFAVAGIPGAVVGELLNTSPAMKSLANAKASKLIAEAQGITDFTKYDKIITDLRKKSSGLLGGAFSDFITDNMAQSFYKTRSQEEWSNTGGIKTLSELKDSTTRSGKGAVASGSIKGTKGIAATRAEKDKESGNVFESLEAARAAGAASRSSRSAANITRTTDPNAGSTSAESVAAAKKSLEGQKRNIGGKNTGGLATKRKTKGK